MKTEGTKGEMLKKIIEKFVDVKTTGPGAQTQAKAAYDLADTLLALEQGRKLALDADLPLKPGFVLEPAKKPQKDGIPKETEGSDQVTSVVGELKSTEKAVSEQKDQEKQVAQEIELKDLQKQIQEEGHLTPMENAALKKILYQYLLTHGEISDLMTILASSPSPEFKEAFKKLLEVNEELQKKYIQAEVIAIQEAAKYEGLRAEEELDNESKPEDLLELLAELVPIEDFLARPDEFIALPQFSAKIANIKEDHIDVIADYYRQTLQGGGDDVDSLMHFIGNASRIATELDAHDLTLLALHEILKEARGKDVCATEQLDEQSSAVGATSELGTVKKHLKGFEEKVLGKSIKEACEGLSEKNREDLIRVIYDVSATREVFNRGLSQEHIDELKSKLFETPEQQKDQKTHTDVLKNHLQDQRGGGIVIA